MSFYFDEFPEQDHLATPMEAVREWAANCGGDACRITSQWLLHDFDVWVKNPHYTGPAQHHPEDEWDEDIDAREGTPPASVVPASDPTADMDIPF